MSQQPKPGKKKKKPRSDLSFRVEYFGLRVFAMILLMFPIEWNLVTARIIGWSWFQLVASHRRRARQHIRDSFGEHLSEREIRRLTLRSMQQLVMVAFEAIFTPRLINAWTWPRYIRLVGLSDAMRLLLEKRGVILLTGHYGSWELLGFTLAALGFDMTAVMRPFDNPYLNRWLLDVREARGLKLLYKKGATESAEDVIRNGGALCFIADQDAGRKGLFADFFGRPASHYKSIGLLAMAMEVPIVVGYARRTGRGFQYEIGVNRIIEPAEWAERDDPLRWITQEYAAAIEAFVREAPEQYLWVHRRWKSQPGGRKAKKSANESPDEADVESDAVR